MLTIVFTRHTTMECIEYFQCCYCENFMKDGFNEIIDHCVDVHFDTTLKIIIITSSGTKIKNFKLIPQHVMRVGKTILANNEKLTLKIRRPPETPSPPHHRRKRVKFHLSSRTSTPKKLDFETNEVMVAESTELLSPENPGTVNNILVTEKIENLSIDDLETRNEVLVAEKMENLSVDDLEMADMEYCDYGDLINEVIEMLPSVIKALKQSDKLDMYIKFQRLLAEQKLPLNNIAFLLFQDVIEWYSLDQVSCMRYSPEVKQFWRIGYKLFKGRFLRFMSGMKTRGQGPLKPSESAINFVVPDLKSLEETCLSPDMKRMEPGIFREMISLLRNDDEKQVKTYKLCFDGKKINPGIEGQVKGDVHLWGYEGPVSLNDQQIRAKENLNLIDELETVLSRLESRDLADVLHATDAMKREIICKGKLATIKINEKTVMKLE